MGVPNYDVLKRLMEINGVTAADISRATKVQPATISHWKNGLYSPKSDKINKIADYFDIPPLVFYGDDLLDGYLEEGYGRKVYDVAAGQGRVNDSFEKTGEYSTIRICGDSMYPSLHDGDLVKVHHVTDDISPSDFAIVKINGDESTCKHIEVTNEGIWLRAENKEVFEDKFYSVQDVLSLPVQIIGKAVSIVERIL